MHKDKQPDAKEAKQFWSKTWEEKEHKKNVEWISNMKKELQGIEESPERNIHLQSYRTTHQIEQN